MPILDSVDHVLIDGYLTLPVGCPFLNELSEPFLEQRETIEEVDRSSGLVDVRAGGDAGNAVLSVEKIKRRLVQRGQHLSEGGVDADDPIQRDPSGVVGDRVVRRGIREILQGDSVS